MVNILVSAALSAGIGLLQRALTPDSLTQTEGARLTNSQITGASEGTAIPRIYRRFRVGGQIIWATTFREVVTVETTRRGGKGGPKQINESTTYKYFCSFAVGICEGEAGVSLRRVFLDGTETDMSTINHRFYSGDAGQLPDPRMEAVEGAGNVPAYRGLSYIVFDELDLTNYGNRIPQVSIEVARLVPATDTSSLRHIMRSVQIIPSTGEFILATEPITKEAGRGESSVANIHTASGGGTDLVVSLNQLQEEAPAVDSASLVVAWFGDTLDAATCKVEPAVETATATTSPKAWRVTDRVRETAKVVSTDMAFNPVYGGTPSDLSVRQAAQEIKRRGMRFMFYPFILMDTTGFPWRGRITGNATNFIGTCTPSHFAAWNGTSVPYSGPSGEWSQRRMILHYARLLADILTSGDAFVVGSEMVGVSASDATWGAKLAALMTDVRAILPAGVLVSYAADWSEYKMTSLAAAWSSASFIGIDNYLPITDWSEGDEFYDRDLFKAGIEGGEYWDYFYADDAARIAGTRSPITDPIFRQKDFRYWRNLTHPGKPIWFTEFGCPAVDKGANQPNVFYDPKSTESQFPYRSNGNRNDTVQRLYLEAMIEYWRDDGLVDPANMFVWTWDARPYPAFPARNDVWSDGPNWERGHWLTGRLGTMTLGRLLKILMLDAGFIEADFDVSDVEASGIQIVGMGVFEVTSPRQVIENLSQTYSFDVHESSGIFNFIMRDNPDTIPILLDDLVLEGTNTFTKTRMQDTDLPDRTSVKFRDEARDFENASVDGHTVTGYSRRVDIFDTYCVLSTEFALDLADTLTQARWVQKDGISFSLPMTYMRIENGDVFDFAVGAVTRTYRVRSITIGDQIDVEAVGYNSPVFGGGNRFAAMVPANKPAPVFGLSYMTFAELPVPNADSPNLWSPRVLVAQEPWPGGVLLFEDDRAGGFTFNSRHSIPAILGQTTTALALGVTDIWDTVSTVTVALDNPAFTLSSTSDEAVLNGANVMAILTPSGEWEVFAYATATLNLDGTYTLSRLLRGLLGTESYRGNPSPVGSLVTVYDQERFGVISGSDARLGLLFDGRYGADGVDVFDNRYLDVAVTPRGVPYRPYSPVHLTQTVDGSDNIMLSWTRRTRFEGDPWADGEVPLNENSEQYEIVITGGRTITVVGATTTVYTSTQQVADFGVIQPSVSWTIYQMSDRFGRGAPAYG